MDWFQYDNGLCHERFKSIHFILQTATWTPFSAPIPATSNLLVFGFNLEKSGNNFNFSER